MQVQIAKRPVKGSGIPPLLFTYSKKYSENYRFYLTRVLVYIRNTADIEADEEN